jgi:sugar/nucleoside kinase (ribokinase family)
MLARVPDLVAIGEVMVDVVAPALVPGGAVHGAIAVRAGGTPVNAALAAVADGATASVVGRVGRDGAAGLVHESLAAAGVEAVLAVDEGRPTGTFLAAGDAIAADPGASAALSPADLPARLAAGAVLVSDYAPAEVARAAVARAETPWVACRGGTVRILNAEEARAEAGLEPDDAVVRLAEDYRLAVVTLGAAGAVACTGGRVERAAPPLVVFGDTTGAGDRFAGVLLASLARGFALDAALVRAVSGATPS